MKNDFNKLSEFYSKEYFPVFDAEDAARSIFENDDSKYLLDPSIVYGKDCPNGYIDYYMYRFLNILKDSERNFSSIISDIQLKHSFNEAEIKNSLMEHNFIRPAEDDLKIDVKDKLSEMGVPQLSRLLKKHGIKASGKRKKLVKLAIEKLPENVFINKFTITSDGLDFLEEFKWIEFFNTTLEEFEFNEFYKYINEHEGNYIQVALDFVDDHLNNAINQNYFKYYDSCIKARADIYNYDGDSKSALCEEIRRMILRLNPIMYTYSLYYSKYLIFNPDNIYAIKYHADELDVDNLEEMFFKIWDSLDLEREYVSKEKAFEYLERLFEGEDYDDVSNEYGHKYFENSGEYFNIGMDCYNDSNFNDSALYFNLSLEVEPGQIDALYYLAVSYYNTGDFEFAMDVIDEAMEITLDDGRFWSIKAICCLDLNQNDKAEEYCNKALKLNPDDSIILRNVGEFYFRNKDFNRALDYFTKACLIDSENSYLILDKAKVLYVSSG